MTTVGYGDVTPKTPEGKVLAITVMLVGIGFAALVVGSFADRFINPPVHELQLTEEDLLAQARKSLRRSGRAPRNCKGSSGRSQSDQRRRHRSRECLDRDSGCLILTCASPTWLSRCVCVDRHGEHGQPRGRVVPEREQCRLPPVRE